MKTKIIFGILSFLLVVFISLLFISDNTSFKVITSPKVFSLLKSSDNEDIKIEVLVNKKDTYYFDKDYISTISLNSELDQETVSLSLEEVSYSNTRYKYVNDDFYLLELSFSIAFNSQDYLIEFEKAYLHINYNNEECLTLFIGEFNYRFTSGLNKELGIGNLSSTVREYKGVSTVSGIFIEVYNMTNENLIIKKCKLGSSSIKFNNLYLSEVYNEPNLFDKIEDVLLIEDYDFNGEITSKNKAILLRENQSIMLYVPLNYLKEYDYIHRFFFEIEYETKEGDFALVIDDIPYVSTSIFQSSLEKGYILYEIPN